MLKTDNYVVLKLEKKVHFQILRGGGGEIFDIWKDKDYLLLFLTCFDITFG